ncbi:hypothetical protein [Goodfellowiella coeruleoviolacea]|uniref:Uncharacterized protein n=1 Tax=Goodfellowiella coeruleoviolacea TaxID=334858 RepID=A0AAE3KI28_9PSEU|nr:hypothetical protein [Goodfellowiella coeruleoviolacea]MCP2168846.1 hypothetical protein [Goodfellowiella coeruleoviolacea]
MSDRVDVLAAVFGGTRAPSPPQPDDDVEFENWARLVEVDADLAGIQHTALHGGGLDRSGLRKLRARLARIEPGRSDLIAWKQGMAADVVALLGGGGTGDRGR